MARRPHHEEHENHERWLVSYADFITLLFAFFVVLYAVSSVDQKRVVQAEKSVRWAMHFKGTGGLAQLPLYKGPPSGGNGVLEGGETAAPTVGTRLAEAARRKLEARLAPTIRSRDASGSRPVIVEAQGPMLRVRITAGSFFDPGSAALRPEALPILDAVMEELASYRRPLRVDGHTDDRTPTALRVRSNWELSALRAAAVVGYLELAHGYPQELLSLGGFAASRPVTTNDTAGGRERNRRIELCLEFGSESPVGTL
ncbi:MAG: flagellar motor protein MotB [Deltaproteobacteria bacterium]|nr:flagellar motor protein MotB [Deltaproteobacteria bacterium]